MEQVLVRGLFQLLVVPVWKSVGDGPTARAESGVWVAKTET